MTAKKQTPEIQEKFQIVGTIDKKQTAFGPYDTSEAADKTMAALVAAGVLADDAKVDVLWTCRTAVTRIRQARPAKPATESAPTPAAPKAARPAGRRGGRRQTVKA